MKKILLTISYDGTRYGGWQTQSNAVTIQQKTEDALNGIFPQAAPIKLVGASRTDAGVHALDQKASFFIDEKYLKIPTENLPLVLNGELPSDITVTNAKFVSLDFHPRYHATDKIYRYQILNSKYPNPLTRNFAWHVYYTLDTVQMEKAAKLMTGVHDFSAFCASGASVKSFVRELYEVRIERKRESGLITIYAKGNGFLYNMVRIIAGTLMYVGCGKIQAEALHEIILSKDRTKAGITAPPHGLTLFKVNYNEDSCEN